MTAGHSAELGDHLRKRHREPTPATSTYCDPICSSSTQQEASDQPPQPLDKHSASLAEHRLGRLQLNLASQERDESMGEFISQLKCLARYSTFDTFTIEDSLHLGVIEGCQSEFLRRRLLKKRYSLDDIEEMTRVNDQAEEHAKKMEARKLEKQEQAFRLQTILMERQSPEHGRIPNFIN
ncbi:hypothetical protein NDU88_003375 [Pleurodeles waltl]|uniref:Uncharacterized protein n=1 Tax=Pleurodeles waltl TaxID=8319 RepID=A0AAV7TNF6_PLEWA|nr:hypothetical protein NDU88_003375 [Pleurodeles waltl]